MKRESVPPSTIVCAHRGASGTHPENTIPAFRHAIDIGCEMVEFNVRMTSDVYTIILHDPTVDRTTDGSGNIWEMDFETVKTLDASHRHGVAYTGVRIPTFLELLDVLPPSLELNIHVYPGPNDTELIVQDVCRQIRSQNRMGSSFISGSEEVMRAVIKIDSSVRRCLLDYSDQAQTYLEKCTEYSSYACQPSNSITTRELCDRARELGLRIHPYFADEASEMKRLVQCGVDGILTNYPERLIELLATRDGSNRI